MAIRKAVILLLMVLSVFTVGLAQKEMMENVMDNDVTVITRNNLANQININRILLIMCYVPWDRNYQEKIGDYQKLAKLLFQATEDVTLAKLDMVGDFGAAETLDVKAENGLQFVLYRKGRSYNFADYTDGKALAKKLKTISDPSWSPPEVPVLVNRVKEISKKELMNDLTKKSFALVLFHNPSSPASQRLLYDYEIAASSIKLSNGILQSFYKFDADDKTETLAKFDVKTLPAFKIFRNGKAYDYNGPLVNTYDMKTYITKHMEKPFTVIPDPAELDVFIKKNQDRSTVVGFFASVALAAFPHFVEAAQTLRDRYHFVLMSTPTVSNGDGAEPQQAPGWTLAVFLPKRQHTPDDEKKSILQYEGASYEMIMDFIKWKATPLAGERTKKNAGLTYALRPLVVVYSKVDWSKANRKDTEYLRDKVASAAKDHKDTLFAFSDSTVFADEVRRFGFDTDTKYDLHVGIIGKDGEYYPRWDTAHMNSKMISEFVKQYKEGEIKPFYRSNQTASLLDGTTGIKELTGESFKTEILDSSSDALVLLYHPLAKHWRLAQSVFKDLSADIGYKRQKVTFAEMDVSTNDVPAYFPLPTYPVIYFVPKNDKRNPVKLSNDLCGEYGIRQFLKQQLEISSRASANSETQTSDPKPAKTEL